MHTNLNTYGNLAMASSVDLESLYEMAVSFPKPPPLPELTPGYKFVDGIVANWLPESVLFVITGPGGSVITFKDGKTLSLPEEPMQIRLPNPPPGWLTCRIREEEPVTDHRKFQ